MGFKNTIYTKGQKLGECIYIKDELPRGGERTGLFLCKCGNKFITYIKNVKYRIAKSCGCGRKIKYKKGQKIGNAIYLKEISPKRYIGKCPIRRGLFKCGCGGEFVAEIASVKVFKIKSCGCAKGAKPIHGLSKKLEYQTWISMKSRCFNKKNNQYKNYGGRGITICKRWMNLFNFIKDMGDRPSAKHTIERINNDKNYKPSNCKWATRAEQNRNTRRNRRITFNNKTMLALEWAKHLKITHGTLCHRLKKWSIEKALTTPKQW